ncbi:conserved hypothetical protein [Echinococcus multilocularis]|uniref:Uncharacterized protein n=1 Tax=Echinococcus multilocularis TaxID=6211 RepID=A0A068YHI1_ECHMU|nr:conserved hypothetical protein [Echinococcus multilocularis]
MGSQQSVLEGTACGPPAIGLEDRHSSVASLSTTPLPSSPSFPGMTSLSYSIKARFRPDANRRRQRPLSCVIPDQGPAFPSRGGASSSRQVVVVSAAPPSLFRSSSTPKVCGAPTKWREDPQWEVYQLQNRVPRFEPLAKWRNLGGSDPTPLVEMVEAYKRHHLVIADSVSHKQEEIICLERKIESTSKRAVESMQLRQRGGEFPNSSSTADSMTTVAAGTYQLERIFKGINELHDRFKGCERLLEELELQAKELEQKMACDCCGGDQ